MYRYTAMATLLARNKADLDVVILLRNEDDAAAINNDHRNAKVGLIAVHKLRSVPLGLRRFKSCC